MSMASSITCFKCPDCESWHPDVIAVRQHMTRRHQRPLVQVQEELQSCLCSQTGPRRTYMPIAELLVAPDNFRTQSLFAQRSLFGKNVPSLDSTTMLTYFPPINEKGLIVDIRKEVKEFMTWIEEQCCQEWSCDLRNRMAGHGFKPIQSGSQPKYISVIAAFCFFCRHCQWVRKPSNLSVGNIMWAALSEAKSEIRMMYMVEKFFFYSYHCMGRGRSSRDLPFLASECAYLKYGLRGGFLHYCLKILNNTDVSGVQEASRHFSDPGAFVQLCSLKNIATSCMPVSNHQHISWNQDANFSSLTVLSVGVVLSHHTIRIAFARVLEFVQAILDTYEVPGLSLQRFKTIKDSPTSTHAGEGLVVFNPDLMQGHQEWLAVKVQMDDSQKRHFLNDSYACANHLVVGLHLSAGPGFRGTEDASITLVNSFTQAPRNIRATGMGNQLQICIIPEYCKQRPLSMGRPQLVAKFLPVRLAVLLIRYMLCMKKLEGLISCETKNCATFLVTNCGHPVKAETYNQVLNGVFRSVGIGVDLAQLRHGLEGFARHLPEVETDSAGLKRNRLMANHSASSSAGYSRDDFTVAQIDADILQQDEENSHVWNTVILNSSNRLSDVDGSDECLTVTKISMEQGAAQQGSSKLQSLLPLLPGQQESKPKELATISSPDSLHYSSNDSMYPEASVQCISTSTCFQEQECSNELLGERLEACPSQMTSGHSKDNKLLPVVQGHHSSLLQGQHYGGRLDACLSPLSGDHSKDHTRLPMLQGHQAALQLTQVQVGSIQFLSSVKEDSAIILPTDLLGERLEACPSQMTSGHSKDNKLLPLVQGHHSSLLQGQHYGGRLDACLSPLSGDHLKDQTRLPMLQGHQAALQLTQVQVESIQFLSSVKEDSAIILPTGSGKTRIIQTFGEGDSVVIVITPFQKLGVQLLDVLGGKAFRWPLVDCSDARCIAQASFIVTAIEHCEYNSAFIQFIKEINESRGISKIFVDEVHHLLEADKADFRPRLGAFWTFRNRLKAVGVHALVVGLTATLRSIDIPRLTELISGSHGTMPNFRRSCYRSSVQFQVGWTQSDSEAQEMCIKETLALDEKGKVIVFGTTIDIVTLLAQRMDCQAVTSGVSIDFGRFDKKRIIVASSCAGHGLDMKDIYAVNILGVPFDAETLLQWAGRIRKSGFVKLFLNRRLVASLSRRNDRRGELAKVIVEAAENNIQDACCRLLDGECELKEQGMEVKTGR
jgi:hypothetical protein